MEDEEEEDLVKGDVVVADGFVGCDVNGCAGIVMGGGVYLMDRLDLDPCWRYKGRGWYVVLIDGVEHIAARYMLRLLVKGGGV